MKTLLAQNLGVMVALYKFNKPAGEPSAHDMHRTNGPTCGAALTAKYIQRYCCLGYELVERKAQCESFKAGM